MSLQPLSRQTKGNEWFHILWTEPSLSTVYYEGEEEKHGNTMEKTAERT